MRTRFVTLAVALCTLAGLTAAPAAAATEQGPAVPSSSNQEHSPRPPSRWWTNERYRQELRLTADQTAQIERIVQDSMSRLKGDKDDLERAQADFRQLMERPSVAERELLKAAERMEMARYSISKERTTMLVRIHSVLSPDQRKKLDAISKRNDSDNRTR